MQSLARPGGNITGVTSIAPDLAAKRLALLKEIAPAVTSVAVFYNAAVPPAEIAMAELPIAHCGTYACNEALLVERLVPILQQELDEASQTHLFRDVEMPLVPVLADMERARLTFFRVPYDYGVAARKIRSAGLPERAARRLERGA